MIFFDILPKEKLKKSGNCQGVQKYGLNENDYVDNS